MVKSKEIRWEYFIFIIYSSTSIVSSCNIISAGRGINIFLRKIKRVFASFEKMSSTRERGREGERERGRDVLKNLLPDLFQIVLNTIDPIRICFNCPFFLKQTQVLIPFNGSHAKYLFYVSICIIKNIVENSSCCSPIQLVNIAPGLGVD